jgi:hypothetical protein
MRVRHGPPVKRAGVGRWVMLAGALLFLSTFVTFAMNFGDFTDFVGRARSGMLRAIAGIVLVAVGGFMSNASAARTAMGASTGQPPAPPTPPAAPVIKVRCSYCGGLNDEDASTCEHCAARF